MAKNAKNNYFEMMAHMVDFSHQAALKLYDCIKNFNPDELLVQMTEMHKIEHLGDKARHDVMKKLMREFITPIEREDIYLIVQIIDDITDAIEDVLINMYIYNVRSVHSDMLPFCELIIKCTSSLKAAMNEFHNFKKSTALHDLIVEINDIENEGDIMFTGAVRSIHTSGDHDAVKLSAWTKIYDCLENCCDLCEHAADAVENSIMKNS